MKKRVLSSDTQSRMTAAAVVEPLLANLGPLVVRATLLEAIAAQAKERRPMLQREASLLVPIDGKTLVGLAVPINLRPAARQAQSCQTLEASEDGLAGGARPIR